MRFRGYFFLILAFLFSLCPARAQQPDEQFRRLAPGVAERRLSGEEEVAAIQERALTLLDEIVISTLNDAAPFDLGALNNRLARLVTHDRFVGENYQVLQLREQAAYALVANFSLGGPAAVRIYAQQASQPKAGETRARTHFEPVARIDAATDPEFFDESVVLVPVAPEESTGKPPDQALFVTVSGRADELQTGAFMAWRFHAGKLEKLWSSEILQQSSYEVKRGEFLLTYCAETDEARPRLCRRMTRDRYAWEAGAWRRVRQTDVPLAKPASSKPGRLP